MNNLLVDKFRNWRNVLVRHWLSGDLWRIILSRGDLGFRSEFGAVALLSRGLDGYFYFIPEAFNSIVAQLLFLQELLISQDFLLKLLI